MKTKKIVIKSTSGFCPVEYLTILFFGNVTIRKSLICLLCSSLESSELFLCFTDSAGEKLLLLTEEFRISRIKF